MTETQKKLGREIFLMEKKLEVLKAELTLHTAKHNLAKSVKNIKRRQEED